MYRNGLKRGMAALRSAYVAAPKLHVPSFPRLDEYVGVWGIEPKAGAALWQAAAKIDLAAHVKQEPPKPESKIEKIPVGGRSSQGKTIAVIKVMGALMKQVPSLTDGSSTVALRRDLRQAAADPDVAAILLAIDSPGGTVAGTDDLARDVAQARKQKPVWAQIEDLGASAAYWIASQSGKIFANSKTALVGSIGTFMVVHDLSQLAENEGIKVLVFSTGTLKGAGVPGTEISAEQEEYFQGLVDAAQGIFDTAVRLARRLSDKQLADVKSGAVFSATVARERNLIDGIQPMDATLEQLAAEVRRSQRQFQGGQQLPATGTREGRAMEFNAWLQARGFDPETLSDDQRQTLEAAFQAEQRDSTIHTATPYGVAHASGSLGVDPNAEIAQVRQAHAAESQRISDIRRLCAEYGQADVEPKAIAEGWTAQQTELHCLRASRPSPAIISRSHENDCTLDALQGALILRCGGRLDNPAYQDPAAIDRLPAWLRQSINADQRQRAMEWAHRFADMSLLDICREAIRLDGKHVPSNRHGVIEAAFSGSALTNIFTTNVNAQLLSTYLAATDTTMGWTSTTDVADFKTNERIRLAAGPNLKHLPRGGEADHADYSDVLESYKVSRYARQFQIDEQDVIDDMLDALSRIPTQFGAAAARLRPDMVYSIILANANLNATGRALFNTTDGNLDSTAALAAATLRAAIEAMMAFQENSINLNIRPTHLIVPVGLWFTAGELINSAQILLAGSTDTERGARNVLADENLTRVSDPRLDNGVTDPRDETVHAGSGTTWYLASNQAHTIEVAYLRGTGRAPQIRSETLSKGKWGIHYDVKLDVGAAALDWRGLHKATA